MIIMVQSLPYTLNIPDAPIVLATTATVVTTTPPPLYHHHYTIDMKEVLKGTYSLKSLNGF